jgi:hypothetical protein
MPQNYQSARMARLDDLRLHNGEEKTRDQFYTLYQQNAEQTINMLNDDGLGFPTLYILLPEISKLSLEAALSKRNRLALDILKNLTVHKHPVPNTDVHEVLKWILLTGSGAPNMGDEYDAIIDSAALLLIKEYDDKESLPLLTEMIFSRHRKGQYTYDAEWALFESRDPECLAMIAKRLRSADIRDITLARQLLAFIPCIDRFDDANRQFQCVMQWISQNRRYLKYTGESNQKCCAPSPYKVVLEQKYLQRPVDDDLSRLTSAEQTALTEFKQLNEDEKRLLSDYSQRLNAGGNGQWKIWMGNRISEQIASAKRWQGSLI